MVVLNRKRIGMFCLALILPILFVGIINANKSIETMSWNTGSKTIILDARTWKTR